MRLWDNMLLKGMEGRVFIQHGRYTPKGETSKLGPQVGALVMSTPLQRASLVAHRSSLQPSAFPQTGD